MKQLNHLSKNSHEFSDKESSKKRPSIVDNLNDPHGEDTGRSSSNSGKSASNFDHSNFALFFNPKKAYPKNSNDSALSQASQLHFKKKSHEVNSSKESSLKRMSSKDSSNIEELCENTSIINYPIESSQTSKKLFSEPFFAKGLTDEYLDILQDDSSRRKDRTQRKSPEEGSFSEPPKLSSKDEKQQQEIIEKIFKMSMKGEEQEQEKVEALVSKDLKLPNSNINVEVLERIMTKTLHPQRNSMLNDPSPQNISISSTSAFENDLSRVRTNNNSVFHGSRPFRKEHSYQPNQDNETFEDLSTDPLRKSISALFPGIESEAPPTFKLDGQTPIKGPLPSKAPTSLLTKSIEAKDIIKSQKKTTAQKNNLSTIASDSTIDSDYLATLTFNHPNTSFSTPFSVKSNSFNNSGKTDFNSPLQADSGKLAENYKVPNVNTISHRQSVPALPFQRTLFNVEQNLMVFYGGHGSGNNTDRSNNSFSWNEEYTAGSAYSSAIGTPQGIHQQNFFNQSLNITPSIDQQNLSQPIGSQTMMSRSSSTNFTSLNQPMNQNIHQNTSKFSGAKTKDQQNMSFSGKGNEPNQTRSKKKSEEQKNSSLFEIDLDRLETNPRTTLMVKNIPNKYDLPMLLEAIEKNHKGKYDFLYLPIDPRNKCNVGYYFINFTNARYIRDFYLEFNARKWERFNSEKICDIKYARIQGKKALMHHFQYSNVMNQQDKKVKPYIPPEYELLDNQKIKDLVIKQKLESAGDI